METLGHLQGLPAVPLAAGILRADRADGPTVGCSISARSPDVAAAYFEQQDLDGTGGRIALRQKLDLQQDGGLTVMGGMLENKVVVISGWGLRWAPPWRADARMRVPIWCWRPGPSTDSRTSPRKVAGDRSPRVAIGTDITDDEQVDNLVRQTLDAYGKVDVLINNAFRVPSMKPFANTFLEHIRETLELTVFGALRMIQGFTPRSSRPRFWWST